MEYIFFEKQEAALCAQHALNMLLQGAYFSAVELSEIAQRLDNEENGVLEATAKNAKSTNMDETGFFSVQVVAEALKPFSLELTTIDHPSVSDIKENPLRAKAFICNQSEHWFTLRKFGSQWFALNSLKSGPELLSDTYISLYLLQLRQEGYSIFVVRGVLPDSEADQIISITPVQPQPRVLPKKTDKDNGNGVMGGIGRRLGSLLDDVSAKVLGGGPVEDDDRQLEEAIRLSLQHGVEPGGSNSNPDEEAELREALRLSMEHTTEDDQQEIDEQDRLVQIALMKSMTEQENVKVRNVPIQMTDVPSSSIRTDPTSEAASEAEKVRRQRDTFLNRF